jgi:hypothetical protein
MPRDGGERGVVPGGQPDHPQPGREQPRARRFQPLLLLFLLPEALDHPDPADGLVDDAGHVTRLLLRVPARREQLAPGRERDHPQRRGDRHGHDRQHGRQHHHDANRHEEQREVAERDRHHGQDALHHVQVGDGPADELPGVDLVLARAVQPGQGVEQLGPHLVLDVESKPSAVVASQVDAAEVDAGRDQEQARQRPDGLLVGHDHVVDDLPLHQRYRGGGHRRHQGPAERDQHASPVPPAVPS